METRLPNPQEIDELVAFLPQLYAEGFRPILEWGDGTQKQDGVLAMSWPEYDELVKDFFRVAASEWWCDHNYRPSEAGRMLKNPDLVKTATLSQIKTMLTFCVRGERFCEGHWAKTIEGDHVRRLLERLAVLRSVM